MVMSRLKFEREMGMWVYAWQQQRLEQVGQHPPIQIRICYLCPNNNLENVLEKFTGSGPPIVLINPVSH